MLERRPLAFVRSTVFPELTMTNRRFKIGRRRLGIVIIQYYVRSPNQTSTAITRRVTTQSQKPHNVITVISLIVNDYNFFFFFEHRAVRIVYRTRSVGGAFGIFFSGRTAQNAGFWKLLNSYARRIRRRCARTEREQYALLEYPYCTWIYYLFFRRRGTFRDRIL